MNCDGIVNFMNRQLRALKDLEELIAHDEKVQTSNIPQAEITGLKTYTETMKSACNTALALAKHYKKEKPNEPKSAKKTEKTNEPKKKHQTAPNPKPEENDEFDLFDFLN